MFLHKKSIDVLISECTLLIKGTSLEYLNDDFNKIKDDITSPMKIAIVGEICSAKSTLVNALLGEEDAVRTGVKEETFNVSWLYYDESCKKVTVYYDDDTSEEISFSLWDYMANRKDQSRYAIDINYLKVPKVNEVLKQFEIIDTPGLDAINNIDSQNTRKFLDKHVPDAIVLLFNRGISKILLDQLALYQKNIFNQMTPLNTVGVLTKIDNLWPGESNPLEAGNRVAKRLMNEDILSQTIFDIYPLSPAMALGAKTISSKDIEILTKLSKVDGIERLLRSEKRFVKSDSSICDADKIYIYNKFTRYGLHLLLGLLDWNIDTLRNNILFNSGFETFIKSIYAHFGKRSYQIKLIKSLYMVKSKVNGLKNDACDSEVGVLREIDRRIQRLMKDIVDEDEIELLRVIYSGMHNFTIDEVEDIRHICGEYGSSIGTRIGLGIESTVDDILDTIKSKYMYWNELDIRIGRFQENNYPRIVSKLYMSLNKEVIIIQENMESLNSYLYKDI